MWMRSMDVICQQEGADSIELVIDQLIHSHCCDLSLCPPLDMQQASKQARQRSGDDSVVVGYPSKLLE